MKRMVVPELLDTDAWNSQEVAASLQDMKWFNRYFGGVSTMSALVRRIAVQRKLNSMSVLDVGGACGDLAESTAKMVNRWGIEIHPVILDRIPTHLCSRYPSVCADALNLPFRENSFDAVTCCLLTHHLEPKEIAAFVREGLRVTRHAVLINDMIRHPLLLALSYAGFAVYRSHISRHDGPASVRRAYTINEMRSLLMKCSTSRIEIAGYHLFRFGAVVWKNL